MVVENQSLSVDCEAYSFNHVFSASEVGTSYSSCLYHFYSSTDGLSCYLSIRYRHRKDSDKDTEDNKKSWGVLHSCICYVLYFQPSTVRNGGPIRVERHAPTTDDIRAHFVAYVHILDYAPMRCSTRVQHLRRRSPRCAPAPRLRRGPAPQAEGPQEERMNRPPILAVRTVTGPLSGCIIPSCRAGGS